MNAGEVDSGSEGSMEGVDAQPDEPEFFGDFGEAQRKQKVQQWLNLIWTSRRRIAWDFKRMSRMMKSWFPQGNEDEAEEGSSGCS